METLEWQEQMQQGRLLQHDAPGLAAIHFQLALELKPGQPEVQLALAQALLAAEDAETALPHFEALAANPAAGPEVDYYKALTHKALQDPSAAIHTLERLLRKHPYFAAARLELGRIEVQAGDLKNAVASFKRYLQLQPGDLRAMAELADALERAGARDDAAEVYLTVYRQDPTQTQMLLRWMELSVQDDPRVMVNLLIQLAIESPNLRSYAALQMASLMDYASETEERQRCLEMALEDPNLPDRPAWVLRAGLALPDLPMSQAELQQAYALLETHLSAFEKELPAGAGVLPDYSNLSPYIRSCTPFGIMCYHNVDPLPWRRRWGELFKRLLPEREPKIQPRSGPLRIGFVLNQNSAVQAFLLDLLRHWPTGMSQQTQVVIFITHMPVGLSQSEPALLRQDFEQYVLPSDTEDILTALENSRLDLLFLTEVHTDQLVQTLLACYRVAPVQVTSWLSSGTSGLPDMDYFLSSKLLEQDDDPQRFYSEKLILLEELPTYLLPRMLLDAPPTRADYGLPEGPLYICPHLMFKMHPDFEAILAEILEQDPAGQLVLISNPNNRYLRNKLLGRMEARFPHLMPRIWFLPRLTHQEYLGLLTLGDVMLDPFYFGGGTTSFEALGLGVPQVTWPGERLHGRITYAYYRAMDVLDCVAYSQRDYVRLAIELANRPDFNAAVRARILAAQSGLFERAPAPKAFAACLMELAEAGRRGQERGAGGEG